MKLKKKFKRIIIIVLSSLLVLALAYGGYKVYRLVSGNNVNEVKIEKEIAGYGYQLRDDATDHYKGLFHELEDCLGASEVNDEEYAKLVAQMVTSDFYNIKNKLSKTDVGGTEFILTDYKESFILEAEESVYKYVEHNIYGNRTQELPVVTSSSIVSIDKTTYEYEGLSDTNSYSAVVSLSYEKDLGYPTEITVKMLHQDNKLEVFYMK